MSLASAYRDATGAVVSSQPFQRPIPANLSSPPTPLRMGPWAFEATLAEGPWNRIYRARRADKETAAFNHSASYAIKALHERHWSDPLAVARFRTEATVGRCVMHPHVSPAVSVHIHQQPYYIVMPLLAGMNAAAMLKTNGKFQTALALWVARQIAEGLEAMHTMGYVHGDVRPAKIFIGADGHATLLDLGCAQRVTTSSDFEAHSLLGSIESHAPELLVGQFATPRSDLYSLGLTMFHMLAGRLPWRSTDAGVIAAWKTSSQTADVREFAPGVPAVVSRFIRALMAVEPLRRPTSAREVAEELVRLEIATLGQRLPK